MSYREENGQVVLAMSHDDWTMVLMLLGAGAAGENILSSRKAAELFNRLNEGNPNFTPYKLADAHADGGPGPGIATPEERNT